MARIKIKDLPKDQKVSKEEMKKIRGGIFYPMSPVPMSPIPNPDQVGLNYGTTDWTYTQPPDGGHPAGNVPGKYSPGSGTS